MVIPKELQSAYQRWEMASFDKERRASQHGLQREEQPVPAPVEILPQVVLPSVEEIEAMREAARQEGYAQGLQEGREQGYAEGRAQGYADGAEAGQIEAAAELEHMRSIAATFGDAVAAADETIAADVLELALQLARGMLRTALEVKPELIIPLVREAVGYLPAVQQPAVLLLHPLDAEIVKEGIGEDLAASGWRIVEDAQIERGGCKVETATNQIDAEASSRWQRLAHSLGRNDVPWLG